MAKGRTGKAERTAYVNVTLEAVWYCPKCETRNYASRGVRQGDQMDCRTCGLICCAGTIETGEMDI